MSSVTEVAGHSPHFKKTSWIRVPIRLGDDVFANGNVSEAKAEQLLEALKAFSILMKINGVDR